MGCACSNSRTAATLVYQYSLETSSPERLLYLAKKRAQVLKLFENLVAAPASRPGLDECILALSKGCQGFIATPSGGETSLIKRCIDQLLPLKVSNEKVVTAFLDFIHDANKSVSKLETKFGRYHHRSSQYMLKSICSISKDAMLELLKQEPEYLVSFVFCVLGIFRYTAGLNFRGGVREDRNALRFIVRLHKHLACICRKVAPVGRRVLVRRFRRDFSQAATIAELCAVGTGGGTKSRGRSLFDSIMAGFATSNRPSPLFDEATMTQVRTALRQGQMEPEEDSEPKLESCASINARPAPGPEPVSPFVVLMGDSHFSDALVDLLAQDEAAEFELVGEHYCCADNCVTLLPRYVLSNLVRSMYTRNETLEGILICAECDANKELFPEKTVRRKTELILSDLFELFRPLPVNRNLVYVIHSAELLDEPFFKTLRRCRDLFPDYVKVVLAMSEGPQSRRALSMLSGSTNIPVRARAFWPDLYFYIAARYVEKPDGELLKAFRDCAGDTIEKLKPICEALQGKTGPRRPLQKRQAIDIMLTVGVKTKAAWIQETMKRIDQYGKHETIEKILLFLLEARSPVPIYLLEEWFGIDVSATAMQVLGEFAPLFDFSTSTLLPDTTLRIRHKRLWRSALASKSKSALPFTIAAMLEPCPEASAAGESLVEVPEYFRLNAVCHYLRLKQEDPGAAKPSVENTRFVSPFWLYSQTEYFKGFDFVLSELDATLAASFDRGMLVLRNQLYIIEGVFAGKSMNMADFYTQLHSRLMGESLPVLKGIVASVSGTKVSYFRPYHSALRENASLDGILETDSAVIALFSCDGYLVYATSRGLLHIHLVPTYELAYQYLIDTGVLSLCYIREGHFLLGGAGPYIYMWTVKGAAENNPVGRIDSHSEGTKKIVYDPTGGAFYSVGGDNAINRGTIEPFTVEVRGQPGKVPVNSLEIQAGKSQKPGDVLVLAGLANGTILVHDATLGLLRTISQSESSIITLNSMRTKDAFLSGSADGEINVFSATTLQPTAAMTVFHITQEDIVAALLCERFSLLIVVERRCIRIHQLASCAFLDEWLYIFKADIRTAAVSKDEASLLVGDAEGKLCVFDLTKPVEQRFALSVPSHRAECSIGFILHTSGSGDKLHHLITCSGERELKVWSRDTCKFIRKYNLTSIASIVPP